MYLSINPMAFWLLLFKVHVVRNQGKKVWKRGSEDEDTQTLCSPEVRLAAINALINSLDFIKGNFEREVRDTCTNR